MSESLTLEIAVDTAEGLRVAARSGADRIELCAALALGGLTPSPGLMVLARDCSLPVRVMIRPRAGDFVYDAADLDQMRRDIDAVRSAGLAGIVLGVSRADGYLDEAVLAGLLDHAAGLETALHRAIDLTPDPVAAVDQAVALGFDTILTSGGAVSAADGVETIAAMAERSGGRIGIMAGSGVTADNLPLFLAAGANAIHTSASRPLPVEPRAVSMGFSPPERRDTAPDIVAALCARLDDFRRKTAGPSDGVANPARHPISSFPIQGYTDDPGTDHATQRQGSGKRASEP